MPRWAAAAIVALGAKRDTFQDMDMLPPSCTDVMQERAAVSYGKQMTRSALSELSVRCRHHTWSTC